MLPDLRRLGGETKKRDYKRSGVGGYWLAEPLQRLVAFYRIVGDRLVDAEPGADRFVSRVLASCELDLGALRNAID